MKLLSPTENQVLFHLSKGATPDQLCQKLGISKANFYVVCSNLRKKTGLSSLSDRAALLHWRHKIKRFLVDERDAPTPCQLRVLRLYAQGKSAAEMAEAMGWRSPHARQMVSTMITKGCARASLGLHSDVNRRQRVAEWLTQHDPGFAARERDPML